MFPNFQNCTWSEKYLKDNKHNSLYLALKICLDICPWTLSVPQSSQFSSRTLSENCLLLRTDNVHGQISPCIFAPNGGYCLHSALLIGMPCLWTDLPLNSFITSQSILFCQLHTSEYSIYMLTKKLISLYCRVI